MGATATTEAILLRRIRFGESSYVLVWLAADHGKIRTAARSTARRDSRLRGRLDLFYHAEISVGASSKSDLHSLREVRLIETWEDLRKDYPRLLAASYFCELCDALSEPGHATPELFDLLHRALAHLCHKSASRRAVEFFESEVCRVLGFGHADNAIGAIESHVGRLPANRRRLTDILS